MMKNGQNIVKFVNQKKCAKSRYQTRISLVSLHKISLI